MMDSPVLSLGFAFDEIAIERELADQRIDLAQTQRQLRVMFQVAAHDVIMARSRFQPQGASLIGGGDTVLLRQVQDAEDSAHRFFA
jgi:hypothetical protein